MGKPPVALNAADVIKARREGILINGVLRARPGVKELARHFGVRSTRISQALRNANDPALFKPKPKSMIRTTERKVTFMTPRRVQSMAGEILSMSPEQIVEHLHSVPKGHQELLAGIQSGKVDRISFNQAAALLDADPGHLRVMLRRYSGKDGAPVMLVPLLPKSRVGNGKQVIDADRFFHEVYRPLQDVVSVKAATAILRLRYGLTIETMPSMLKELGRVPTVSERSGFRAADFLRVLNAYDSKYGRPDINVRLLKTWANDTRDPSLRSVSHSALSERILKGLESGMFSFKQGQLRRSMERDVRLFRGALGRVPNYRLKPNGEKPRRWLRQDKAALHFLGADNPQLLREMTHEDRTQLGRTIAELVKAGKVPLYLPNADKKERDIAYQYISEALLAPGTRSAVLRRIGSTLTKGTATQMGTDELRRKIEALLPRRDVPLLKAYDTLEDVYPALYARLRERQNGKMMGLRVAVGADAPHELRYPLFSHLATVAGQRLNGRGPGYQIPQFRAYVRREAARLDIEPGYVLGFAGVPMGGLRMPRGVDPWEFIRMTMIEQQKRARLAAVEATQMAMKRPRDRR